MRVVQSCAALKTGQSYPAGRGLTSHCDSARREGVPGEDARRRTQGAVDKRKTEQARPQRTWSCGCVRVEVTEETTEKSQIEAEKEGRRQRKGAKEREARKGRQGRKEGKNCFYSAALHLFSSFPLTPCFLASLSCSLPPTLPYPFFPSLFFFFSFFATLCSIAKTC